MKHIFLSLISYLTFIRWLLKDSLWRKKWLTSFLLLSGFIGVSSQGAVFGLIVYYARHFSSGESIELIGYTIDPRTSLVFLVSGSLLVVLLLLLSTLCIYFSRRTILKMGRDYEEFCAVRVFSFLGEGGNLFLAMKQGVSAESYLFRLVKSDSRFAGRILRILLTLIIPGITLFVAIIILLSLDAILTLIIAILASALFYLQYRAALMAAQQSIRFENLASASSAEYKEFIQHYKYLQCFDMDIKLEAKLFTSGPVKKQLDAYEGRLRSVENSRLASGLFTALIVGLIILIMGTGIIQAGAGWGRLLVYVVALRFAMVNLQKVFSSFTNINRFYPQVNRYFAFVRSFAEQNTNLSLPGSTYTLHLEGEETDLSTGSLSQFEVRHGMRMALVTPLELNRYTLSGLCQNLFGSDEPAAINVICAARYASVNHSCPASSLRCVLGLSSDSTRESLQSWFPDSDRWAQLCDQLPGNLDKPITLKLWERVDPSLKFVLSLISARLAECPWIFIQAKGLMQLTPEEADFYLAQFDGAVSVIVHNTDLDQVGFYAEDVVAVADENCLLGLGSSEWFSSVKKHAAQLFDNKVKNNKKAFAKAQEDEDLDE